MIAVFNENDLSSNIYWVVPQLMLKRSGLSSNIWWVVPELMSDESGLSSNIYWVATHEVHRFLKYLMNSSGLSWGCVPSHIQREWVLLMLPSQVFDDSGLSWRWSFKWFWMRLISPEGGFSNMRGQWPLLGVVFQVRWFMREGKHQFTYCERSLSLEGACSLKYLMAVVSLEGPSSSKV